MTKPTIAFIISVSSLIAADSSQRKVDPTFLHRYIPDVQARPSDLTTATWNTSPIFGAGDSAATILKGVQRFGQIIIQSGGWMQAGELSGGRADLRHPRRSRRLKYASDTGPVKKNDFMYLPAGIQHGVSNNGSTPLRLFVMGFKVPAGTPPPPKLQIANIDEIKPQTVGGHPDSVVYQLMMGDTTSKRDRLACAHLVTSLFLMTFQPGGTNFPHHHDDEEEIYVLLDGTGNMVAGSGMDGVEGRFPAKPGDAYFFRLNTTVGFYNSTQGPGSYPGGQIDVPTKSKAGANR